MKVVRLQGYHLKRPQRPLRGLMPAGTLPLPQHLNVICQQNIHSTKTYACLHRASTLISHIKEVSSFFRKDLIIDQKIRQKNSTKNSSKKFDKKFVKKFVKKLDKYLCMPPQNINFDLTHKRGE